MHLSVLAVTSAVPFEGPSEANLLVALLGDSDVMAFQEGTNGGVPTGGESRGQSFIRREVRSTHGVCLPSGERASSRGDPIFLGLLAIKLCQDPGRGFKLLAR